MSLIVNDALNLGGAKDVLRARIEWSIREGGEFSMVGEIYYKDGGESGGQCIDTIAELYPQNEKVQRMHKIWKRWHLNHLRAGCIHQMRDWDTGKELELIHYKPTLKFYAESRKAQWGELPLDEYERFQDTAAIVREIVIGRNCPKYETLAVFTWKNREYIAEEKREKKTAGWVHVGEHPEGLLMKPCEICGYKYGSAWLKEELPPEVIEEILSWSKEE